MQSNEENYYELLEAIQEFKMKLSNSDLLRESEIARIAWEQATALETTLNTEEFEELI